MLIDDVDHICHRQQSYLRGTNGSSHGKRERVINTAVAFSLLRSYRFTAKLSKTTTARFLCGMFIANQATYRRIGDEKYRTCM